MVNLLVITDQTIQAMFDDPRFTQLLPCLDAASKDFQRQRPSCGACHGKMQALVSRTMQAAKQCLTSLPAPKRSQLKQLLDARQVRIIKSRGDGRKIQVTF